MRLKKALHPVLFVPNAKSILIIIAGGIIAPFILWRLLIFLQAEARDVSLDYNSINYLLQGMFLVIGTTLWPMVLTRYFIDLRAKKLGLITKTRLNGLILILTVLIILGLLACFSWRFSFNLELSTCFSNSYLSQKYMKMYNIYRLKLWHLWWGIGFLTGIFIISAPLISLCHWRKKTYLFKQGVNAAAILVVLSIILGVSALLAEGYFYWKQAHFMTLSTSPHEWFMRRRENLYKPIFKVLNKNKRKVKNINITYAFTDDKSFCLAIKSSPYSILKESLNRGADVNAINGDGYSTLMLACRYRDAKVVKLLLKNGVKVDKYCAGMQFRSHKFRFPEKLSGVNALMVASYYNLDSKIIKLLLKHGANVNSKSLKGYSRQANHSWLSTNMTPLMFACWNNNAEIINILLDNGASVHDKNRFGKDVLYYLGKNPKIYGNKIKNRIKALRKAEKR